MQDYYETHKAVLNAMTRVDSTGILLYTFPYSESSIGRDLSSQDHVRQVLSTHETVVSDVFLSVQGYYAIAVHVPIFDKDRFAGSLAILIPIDELGKRFLDNGDPNRKGQAWLITENQMEIIVPSKTTRPGPSLKPRPGTPDGRVA
ncbi:MAG: hypothetical protein R2751_07420 [Bacteroidales bacterium]